MLQDAAAIQSLRIASHRRIIGFTNDTLPVLVEQVGTDREEIQTSTEWALYRLLLACTRCGN